MLKQDSNTVFPDHCLPSKGQDNHHSTLFWNGKEEERVNLGKWNKKDPVRWPRMSAKVNWNALKNSVYLQLPTNGPIAKKKRFCMRKLLIYLAL